MRFAPKIRIRTNFLNRVICLVNSSTLYTTYYILDTDYQRKSKKNKTKKSVRFRESRRIYLAKLNVQMAMILMGLMPCQLRFS